MNYGHSVAKGRILSQNYTDLDLLKENLCVKFRKPRSDGIPKYTVHRQIHIIPELVKSYLTSLKILKKKFQLPETKKSHISNSRYFKTVISLQKVIRTKVFKLYEIQNQSSYDQDGRRMVPKTMQIQIL